MNYYRCGKCGQKYTGWGQEKTCRKCGGELIEITEKEFNKKDKKEVESDHKISS